MTLTQGQAGTCTPMSRPKPPASVRYLRIGDLARRSGTSAKALRLYEQRGLLTPCAHSEAGYRLYGPDAMQRLMRIVLLKRSGFTLAEIAGLLASGSDVIGELLADRIAALERDVADKAAALATLRTVAGRLGPASTTDQLLESITMTRQSDLRITETQREALRERAERFRGTMEPAQFQAMRAMLDERLQAMSAEELEARQKPWRELSADIRAAMDARTPTDDPIAIALARRWQAWVGTFLGGSAAAVAGIREMYARHPEKMVAQSMSPALIDYMDAAMAAAGLQLDN